MHPDLADTFSRSLRWIAQRLRHAPGLRGLSDLWRLLRAPYGAALRLLSAEQGLPIAVAGHSLRLDPHFANLRWDRVEAEPYRAFSRLISAGNVVYDVGAHIGTYTLIALRCGGPDARVVAYEPADLTRAYLLRHLSWNRATEQVVVRSRCCGDKSGMATFYFDPRSPEGTNGLLPLDGCISKTVTVSPLDEEVEALGMIPDLVKVDVEGAEMQVLRGAEQTLVRHKPALLLSLHPEPLAKQGMSPQGVLDWLAERGYRCRIISRDHEIHVVAQAPGNTRVRSKRAHRDHC